jgi:hypothetical protein
MNRIDESFITDFKQRTEALWKHRRLNLGIYGFQIQAGTCWNLGLHDDDIEEYKRELRVHFPDDFRLLLRHLNGTDLPTLNVYGNSGEPHATGPGVYSYPRDLELVKKYIEEIQRERDEISTVLRDEGFDLKTSMGLVPFYSHRFLVCSPDLPEVPVLSIVGTDAIVYAPSLHSYLEREFLKDG